MDDRVARLTEGQREALRMVYRHMETKEIARELGISPDGVTQRIKGAMRTLGVNKRRDAANILADAEEPTPYPREVYPPRDIATPSEFATMAASTEGERQNGPAPIGAMWEEQSVFETAPALRTGGLQLPLPIRGSKPDDLDWLRRLGWIIAIMLLIALVFGMFLAGFESLSRLGQSAGS